MRKLRAALVVAGLLAGCGFQLRGETNLAFSSLYIDGASASPVAIDLRRFIQASGSTRIAEKAGQAQASLQVLADTREKIILSLTGGGKVREYQLRERVSFRLADSKNQDLIPINEIVISRVVSFNDTQVLAKEGEEALLYRDMQNDAVQQILRRLAVVRLPI